MALFQAAPALNGVKVVDGPLVTGNPLHEVIFVGYDGSRQGEGDGEAVDLRQEWASIGQKAKDETFTVTCAVVVWSGSTKVRPIRERAFALLAAVEDALRADPSLGLPPPTIVAFVSGSLFQEQPDTGMQARIPFRIAVQTRI
ncbi:hypothetical protein ETD86_34845 [Nonomuraea turkmeniaca]|uniref:DUF3168 domain-containing protein n=1 Tax=Nonomuraea turkmeniaca TaxID=103838 RepID=A0A5S4F705_9ACTN|nr:hypothetical protein [Nonomuraea turkmeniaca]TMR11749.1 hypothetical protein ETD86_34845 [Nonomuraea turkmeniaca]